MGRPVLMLAGLGVAGVVLYKILGMLIFPLIGVMLGIFIWVVKAAIIAALIWWGYHLFKRWNEGGKTSEA
jgi:hypothetical protein